MMTGTNIIVGFKYKIVKMTNITFIPATENL